MDPKTSPDEAMASLPDAARREHTNKAAVGAYRSRKIILVTYLYTNLCDFCLFEYAPESRPTKNVLGQQT